jgi:hypothetical protein
MDENMDDIGGRSKPRSALLFPCPVVISFLPAESDCTEECEFYRLFSHNVKGDIVRTIEIDFITDIQLQNSTRSRIEVDEFRHEGTALGFS